MRRWVGAGVGALLAVAVATAGHAQQLPRKLPPNGKLGVLAHEQPQPFPLLLINNKTLRLAPGGRIYDRFNRSILHNYLPRQAAYVLYTQDPQGFVSQLYLLRPDEFERLERAAAR
ncbi:MAG: hypothetical protein HYV99_05305 [Betaproteobacteria bacterium]|nr:hypothetical protein [Betaproteobacteria bacterium]